jgi:hypothetical protein
MYTLLRQPCAVPEIVSSALFATEALFVVVVMNPERRLMKAVAYLASER